MAKPLERGWAYAGIAWRQSGRKLSYWQLGSRKAVLRRGLALYLFLCFTTVVYAHGDLHEQIEMISGSIEKTPTAELYLKRGELHRAHQDYPAALADYDRAQALDTGLEAVHLARGRALVESGRYADAERELSRFLEKKPDHALAYLYRARAAVGRKQLSQAAADYDRVISLSTSPKPDLYLERADVLKADGQFIAALISLEQGIAKLGSLVTLEKAALELEVELKQYEAALKRIDRLLAGAQRKETWLERKASIFHQSGRNKEAKTTYAEALTALTALPLRLRNVRATQEIEKRIREALATFRNEPA